MSNLQIELNPQELHGIWRAGYALDFYSVPYNEATKSGERTEIGGLVDRIKGDDDRSKIQPIAEIAAKFVEEEFVVDGHPVLPHISTIIPAPPSKPRPLQPVPEIVARIGSLLDLSVRTDYLIKVKQTPRIRYLPVARRQAAIQGAFDVQSQDLQGRCVLLFDDVYETGTTLTEATDVLHNQGHVSRVLVLTLTRTYQH